MGWFGLLISVSVEEPCMVWLLKGESQLPNLQGPRTFIQRLILRRETSGLGKLDKEEVWAAINEKKRLRPEGDVRHNWVKHDSEPEGEYEDRNKRETGTHRADFSNLKRDEDPKRENSRDLNDTAREHLLTSKHSTNFYDKTAENKLFFTGTSLFRATEKPCWKACSISSFCTARDFDRTFRRRLFKQMTGLENDPSERMLFTYPGHRDLLADYDIEQAERDPFEAKEESYQNATTNSRKSRRAYDIKWALKGFGEDFDHMLADRRAETPTLPLERPRSRGPPRIRPTQGVAQALYPPFKDTALDFEVSRTPVAAPRASLQTALIAPPPPCPCATRPRELARCCAFWRDFTNIFARTGSLPHPPVARTTPRPTRCGPPLTARRPAEPGRDPAPDAPAGPAGPACLAADMRGERVRRARVRECTP